MRGRRKSGAKTLRKNLFEAVILSPSPVVLIPLWREKDPGISLPSTALSLHFFRLTLKH